jgi:hypothetical protein
LSAKPEEKTHKAGDSPDQWNNSRMCEGVLCMKKRESKVAHRKLHQMMSACFLAFQQCQKLDVILRLQDALHDTVRPKDISYIRKQL